MATKRLVENKITVKPGDNPPAPEVLAQAIVDISRAANLLLSSRLQQKTIELLISHSAKVPQRDVRAVLVAASFLERDYLKPRRPAA